MFLETTVLKSCGYVKKQASQMFLKTELDWYYRGLKGDYIEYMRKTLD
jgi:hypothetical protein